MEAGWPRRESTPYDTDLALELALARQAQWVTVAPADLREHALTIASDAWLLRMAREMKRTPGLRSKLEQLPMDTEGWPSVAFSLEVALCQGVPHARHVWRQWQPALHTSPGHQVWGTILQALEAPDSAQRPDWATQVLTLLAKRPVSASLVQDIKLKDRLSPWLQVPMDEQLSHHEAAWQSHHRTAMATVVQWANIVGPAVEHELASAPPPENTPLPEPSVPRRRRPR